MSGVNLLPEKERHSGPSWQSTQRPLAALAAVAVIGAVGYWGVSTRGEADRVAQQVAVASAERDALQTQVAVYSSALSRQQPDELRRGAVVALAAGRTNWERVIRDVSAVTPRQIWFTALRASTAAGTSAATVGVVPTDLHIEGVARSHSQVANLMERMDAVEGVGTPRLASSEMAELGGRDVVNFVLDADLDRRAQDHPTLTPAAAGAVGAGATPEVTP